MRALSRWASHHVRLAILLLILGEVANGFNGVLLGANILDQTPLPYLYAGIVSLIGLALFAQVQGRLDSTASYWAGRRCLFTAFLSNYLLFNLLGGVWNRQAASGHSAGSVIGARRIEVVRDTIPATDSVRLANRMIMKKSSSDQQIGSRLGFVALGVVGIIAALFIAALACNLGCAGYGFFAFLTFCLGLGSMAGSVYFFSRAGQTPFKRRRDMTAEERRRDGRRFWLPWAILVGIFSVILLISAFNR